MLDLSLINSTFGKPAPELTLEEVQRAVNLLYNMQQEQLRLTIKPMWLPWATKLIDKPNIIMNATA